ncbi:MAG: phage antirepressor KilAC domain-containing protein, partial [Oscillospiraceae bacterium]
ADAQLARMTQQVKVLEIQTSELTVANQVMKPKADYFDELVDRNLLTGLRETAKELHIGQKVFINFLLVNHYLYRTQNGILKPYAQYIKDGLFDLKECINEKSSWKGTQVLVTPKGRETFRMLCI